MYPDTAFVERWFGCGGVVRTLALLGVGFGFCSGGALGADFPIAAAVLGLLAAAALIPFALADRTREAEKLDGREGARVVLREFSSGHLSEGTALERLGFGPQR